MEPIKWQAYEYEFSEKSSDWFWALGIIAVSSSITAIIFENLLFALLILIGAASVALFAARRPHLTNFEVNEKGVLVDKILYPYRNLEAFWIEQEEGEEPKVIISSQRFLMPYIVVPIHRDDVEKLQKVLEENLKEEEMEEPVSHKILEFFGF
ncbi:MAG: hypothetical protein QF858_03980 [Candidatus Pacebacteria bacterium]|jgi:hypothetical protein|nr:hypothetical protein [bacterium]MDP6528001.1 hypothetical protein [Candidatus Paceibacterota bacterium]MDP6659741.1 hypothetical protein [Candidatus Paceibacterota bacterium]|tara:strand:+ start:2284 stop:2742 length:459 start_codon:yes stop_codon:yes gene_type:complete